MKNGKVIHQIVEGIPEKLFVALFLAIVFLHEFLLNIQGIGMQDEGWVLTAYQQIFTHPTSVSYNFLYYNSLLVGGVWNLLFGKFGIIAFRFLAAFCEAIIAYLSYIITKPYVTRLPFTLGYLTLLMCRLWYTSFDHNSLSILLCLVAILLIIRAIERNAPKTMFWAGMIIGINIFTRIPNIAHVALIIIVIPYYLRTKDYDTSWRMFVFAFIGIIVGVVTEIGLMTLLGHVIIFWDNLSSGILAATASDSTHNLLSMLKRYFLQGEYMFIAAGFVFLLPGLAQAFFSMPSNIKRIAIAILVIICGRLIFIFEIRWLEYSLVLFGVYIVFACLFLSNISKKDTNLLYMQILSMIMLFVVPLGSDWGYKLSLHIGAASLIMPLGFEQMRCRSFEREHYSGFFNSNVSLSVCVTLFCTVVFVANWKTHTTGEESGLRLETTYQLDNSLATVYTSRDACNLLNPLLAELKRYVKEDEKLFCFHSIAMIHYLTHTQPYLENAWVWTYTSEDMRRHMQKALKNNQQLPVLVRQKTRMYSFDPDEHWNNDNAPELRFHQNEKVKIINEFIKDYNYSLVWENEAFQILLPEKNIISEPRFNDLFQ